MTIRNITGTVEYADGAIPQNSRAEFYLNGIHIDAVTIAHSAVYVPLDGTGDISAWLYPNSVGYGADRYNVDLVTYSDSEYVREVRRVNLGKIYVEDVDGQTLQELLALFTGPAGDLSVAEQAAADAIAAASAAAASAATALSFTAVFDSFADMVSDTSSWPVDTIIKTRDPDWSYQVVSPLTIEQHVITAGSVKLFPLPRHDGFITAQQCGISTVGDQTVSVQAWVQWAIDNGYGFDLGGETFTVSRVNFVGDATLINGGLISNKAAPEGTDFQDDVAFEFGGEETTEIAVSNDFEIGADRLVLASVAGIVVGDLLHLNSTRLIDTDHRGGWTEGQIVKVTRVSGNTVYLAAPLCYSGRASTVVTGTISAISGDRYTLTVNNVIAGAGRDRTAKITITSGASSGEERFCIAASATTLRHSGGVVGEWDRTPWPAGVLVGNTYEHAWRSTVTIIKPAKVVIRDVEFTRAATFAATAGDDGFRGLRVQYSDEPVVERCTVQNFATTNIHMSKCYRPALRDCDVSGSNRAYGGFNGTGYGVSIEVCSAARVNDVRGQACRRVVDVSGSSGYSEHALIDGVTAYGGGRSYEGLDFWPTGTQQQSVAGSHGSGRFTDYRNCVGIDTYLGMNLRGRSEIVTNYAHWGYGMYALNINYGCGHVIDGVSYADKFVEETRGASSRQVISTNAAKRLEAIAFIDWASSTFVGNLITTIRNVRASSVSRCGILSSGTGALIRNLVMENWHMTASAESGAYSTFTFMDTSGSATIDECYFSNINFKLASGGGFSGVEALFGIPSLHDVLEGGKVKIDDVWIAKIAINGVVRFPCLQSTATVDLLNVRTGARPRCNGLMIQDASASTLNVADDKTLLDVLATYPVDGSGVTAGSMGVNLSAANGFLSVANNTANAQTFRINIV